MSPRVAFILTCYNHEPYIAQAVAGALAQTYEPLTVIVSDDASTDGSWAEIQRAVAGYAGPHQLIARRNPANLGVDHYNLLLTEFEADIFVLAQGDDISFPDRTAVLVRELVARDASIINANAVLIDHDGTIHGVINALQDEPRVTLELICRDGWHYQMTSSTCAITRQVVSHFGPFDPEQMPAFGFDQAMGFRAALLKGNHYLAQPLTFKRQHAKNICVTLIHNKSGDAAEFSESVWEHDVSHAYYMMVLLQQEMQRRGPDARLARAKSLLTNQILDKAWRWVRVRNRLRRRGLRNWWLDAPPPGRDTSRNNFPAPKAIATAELPGTERSRIEAAAAAVGLRPPA